MIIEFMQLATSLFLGLLVGSLLTEALILVPIGAQWIRKIFYLCTAR